MTELVASEKIQKISEHLKAKVIEPAEIEKQSILDKAAKEREEILNQAKKEAEDIVSQAEERASQLKSSTESALKIAAKQAVNSLKLSLENEVLKKSVSLPTEVAFNDSKVLKEVISEMVKAYSANNFTGGIDIMLNEKNTKKLKKFVLSEVGKSIKNGITLNEFTKDGNTSDGGVKVVFKGNQLMFDLSDTETLQIFCDFIKPELRRFLFE